MRSTPRALGGFAAVTVALSAVTACTTDAPVPGRGTDAPGRPGTTVTRIAFTEELPREDDPSVTAHKKVEVFAEHRADSVSRLRFVIASEERRAEERLWDSGRPGTITVRDWQSCTSTEEPTPAPHPDSLDVVLGQYFGPRGIPPEAKKVPGGGSRWETPTGMMVLAYTDLGGPYPHRIVQVKGPDGSVGSTIGDTRADAHPSFPGWRTGWPDCRPDSGTS
ncbi:hypothetical protein ACIQHY_08350 [Streptomyces sp. NPDC092359]|uniref:hypothetical protein n=1 Tax=Streptomyces sp. NPDC092359 TaxID=3366014 RepID=UPI00380FDEA9